MRRHQLATTGRTLQGPTLFGYSMESTSISCERKVDAGMQQKADIIFKRIGELHSISTADMSRNVKGELQEVQKLFEENG